MTVTGAVPGSYEYMAQEQLSTGHADQRSDLYSLGATFYELLTRLKPVPLHVAKVPTRWQGLVARCCEPEPDDRFQTATDLLAALQEARHASSVEAIAEPGENEDDLRCPSTSCRRMNALEARFCRGCGEGLQVTCPACEAEYRVGLRHCDKCGAAVETVRDGRERLEAARDARRPGAARDARGPLQRVLN